MGRQVWALGFCLLLSGCKKDGFGPVSSPPEDHPAYAATYPAELDGTSKLYSIERGLADEFPAELSKFPEALTEPDWALVKRVYELANEDGKSAHYAEVRKKNAEVAAFFVEEKKELVQKIGGGVQYHAEQKNCDAEFYGPIDRGLEKGLTERFEEREEAASRAQTFITQNEEALGKKNVEVLSDQAKQISAAANLVYVSLAERHAKLKELVEKGEAVDKTIERRLKEMREEPGKTEAEKESQKLEREALLEARGKIKQAVEEGKQRLETSEEDIKAARKKYDDAFKELLLAVDAKAGAKG